MKMINRLPAGVFLAALAGTTACANDMPPKDLTTARATYERASHGPAAKLAQADLHGSSEALNAAEKSFTDNGDEQETRDMAYTSIRRSELAEAHARTMIALQAKAQTEANQDFKETQDAQRTTAELGRANALLATQGRDLKDSGRQLADETSKRLEAEKRAALAAADLARLGSVKQEARGMVITLSGGVLFQSAKSELTPSAQIKLNEVAEALTKQDPDSKIVVEGHTDSQGGAAFNQDLSQRRAQAVRDYLVSRGLSADRVTAQGFGLTRAVADNTSTEGRANNRRVEIVIQKSGATP